MESDDALQGVELSSLSNKIADASKDDGETQVDLGSIFSKFQ